MPELPMPQSIAFGVLLIIVGASFGWKTWNALIKGRMLVWYGFLPFTIVSPFLTHLPPGKNSLVKWKEAMWVHVVFGPIFFCIMVLSIAAGIDFIGFSGTQTLNDLLTGNKLGAPPAITFSKTRGYQFPFIPRASAHFGKLFGGKLGLKDKDKLYDTNGQTEDDRSKQSGY
ncbi:MAG TPA: hypothetical protein V6C86_21460 [Oculatellaceae cyanobacterium]